MDTPPPGMMKNSGRDLLQGYLPNPSFINESAKMADMICISPKGLCGGNDFRYPFFKEGKLPAGKAGNHQGKKSRYAQDNKILLKPLK
jgi:hypothetical protein